MANYDSLVENQGTIFNQAAKVAYQNPDQLAADLGVTASGIQWGNIAKAGAGFDPTGYAGFTPPNPTAPVSGSTLGSPSLNYSTGVPPDNGSSAVAGMIGGMNASQPSPEAGALDKATTDFNSASSTYKGMIDSAPDASTLLTQNENANGVPQAQNEVNQLNVQIAEKTAAYNQAYQNTETKGITSGTPAVFFQGEQAAIQRQKAVELGNLGLIQAAKQGNLNLAEQRAQTATDLQYKSAQDKITNAYNFLRLNQDNLSAVQQRDFSFRTDQKQAELNQAKATTTVLQNMAIQAASGGAPQTVVQQAMGTNDPVQAASILSTYLKGPTESVTSGVTEGTMFKVPTAKELGGSQFYKYPESSQVYTSAGKPVDLATYKQLTGQQDVPDEQVKFSGIKSINPTEPTTPKAPKVTVQEDVSSMSGAMSSVKGADGYVSPEDWKTALAAWVDAGRSAASFKTNFSNFINPEHPKDY